MKNSTRWIRVWIFACNFLWLSAVCETFESTLLGQVIPSLSVSEPESHGLLQVEGTVLDLSDRPVSGARIVVLRFDSMNNFDEYLHHDVKHSEHVVNLAEGQTDKTGAFRLPLAKLPYGYPLTVIAYRDGHSPGTALWNGRDQVRIKLRSAATINGTVVDQDNKPITAARVALMSWISYEKNQNALARNVKNVDLEGHLIGDAIRIETRTALGGKFRLGQLPADRWVVLTVTADGFLPKCVVADTGNDPALETAVDAQLLFDGGVVRLTRATRLELIAVAKDTGQPIRLKEAFTSLKLRSQSRYLITDRAKKIEVRGNRASLPVLPPGEQRFWLIPEVDSGYMGAMLDLEADEESAVMEERIELSRGARVVGRVVDQVTDEPIEGAAIHYEPESSEEFQESGASVPSVKSDKNGEFAMNVPAIDGWLRQIGRVDGYRSVYSDFNLDVRGIAPAHRISPTMDTETRVEFRLQPATRVVGQVVNTQGQPVAYANYAARERVTQSGFGTIDGKTDEQGRFAILNIFAEKLINPPGTEFGQTNDQPQESIFFWSPDRQSTATVKMPYPAESKPDISLQVVLTPAATITGRIVDLESGAGVSDVEISVWYQQGPSSTALVPFSSTSDENGHFTMTPIFSDTPLRLHLRGEYVGQQRGAQDTLFLVSAGVEHSVGELPMLVYRDLEQLLELPDTSNLSTEQALQVLLEALTQIRARISEVATWQGGQNYLDSISVAELTAAEKFGEAFLKLSQRASDPELAFQILKSLLINLDTGWAQSFYSGRAKMALLERFLDREDMPEVLPRILAPYDSRYWQLVYDQTKNERLKMLACQHLVHSTTTNMQWTVIWDGYSLEHFDEELAKAQRLWTYALRKSEDATLGNEQLRQSTVNVLRQLLRQIETISAPDRTRIDRLKRVIKELLPEE